MVRKEELKEEQGAVVVIAQGLFFGRLLNIINLGVFIFTANAPHHAMWFVLITVIIIFLMAIFRNLANCHLTDLQWEVAKHP